MVITGHWPDVDAHSTEAVVSGPVAGVMWVGDVSVADHATGLVVPTGSAVLVVHWLLTRSYVTTSLSQLSTDATSQLTPVKPSLHWHEHDTSPAHPPHTPAALSSLHPPIAAHAELLNDSADWVELRMEVTTVRPPKTIMALSFHTTAEWP